MSTSDKDTIYIDIDDEITGIIDKVHASSGKVVALVLPKRASVFQSIVNMKLLKRAADASKKHLVLITSEAGLLPLAGMAGVHVAKTLTSKPEIPAGPTHLDDPEETVAETEADLGDDESEVTAATAGDEPVGKLAGPAAGAAAAATIGKDGVETLVLDDEATAPEAAIMPKSKSFEPPKGAKKKKGLHIPNFERFRLLLVLGGLALILLIGGGVFAATALPKASINIDTNAVNVDANLNLNLATAAKTLSFDDNTIPAKLQQQQKTFTQQSATTGQKNNGTKASGTVSLSNCSQTDDINLPAGSGLSSGGNTYITQQTVVVPTSSFNKKTCQKDVHVAVDVIAQSPGSAFNGANSFTVPSRSDLSGATSSPISGGTDNIVQIVNQNDINGAKAKINIEDPSIKQDLQDQLKQAGYYAIPTTYSVGTPAITTSASVGQVADTVTVTEIVTYTMFGVHESDLKATIDNSVKTQIDTSKQTILSQGLNKAKFTVTNASATNAQIALSTVATAGPDLDKDAVKRDALGQKAGKIQDGLKNRPGVKNVTVKLSPFWVSSVPKKADRVTVNIAEPTTTASKSDAGNP